MSTKKTPTPELSRRLDQIAHYEYRSDENIDKYCAEGASRLMFLNARVDKLEKALLIIATRARVGVKSPHENLGQVARAALETTP